MPSRTRDHIRRIHAPLSYLACPREEGLHQADSSQVGSQHALTTLFNENQRAWRRLAPLPYIEYILRIKFKRVREKPMTPSYRKAGVRQKCDLFPAKNFDQNVCPQADLNNRPLHCKEIQVQRSTTELCGRVILYRS